MLRRGKEKLPEFVETLDRVTANKILTTLKKGTQLRFYGTHRRIKRRNKKEFDMYTDTWYTTIDKNKAVTWMNGKSIVRNQNEYCNRNKTSS